MAEDEGGERSEEATQQRRDDFRKRGQVVQSKELGSVLMFFGSALAFWTLSRFYTQQMRIVFEQTFGFFISEAVRADEVKQPVMFAAQKIAILVLPMFAVFGVIAFASSTLQVGFLSKEDALEPNFEHLNPVSGFKKMLSLRSVVEAFKASMKLIIVGFVAWPVVKSEFYYAPMTMGLSVDQLGMHMASVTVKLFLVVGMFMAFLAALDYGYQWWDLERQMRMTKQEIKEEHKNREGDPQIKARIRKIQRDLAQKRMMDAVPKADVIITNPTHIAVALKYDAKYPAPQLVAKGADLIAEKIKAKAREHNIPVVENKPLARTIYKTLKIGQVVPRELYNAVAEVLAYVYRLKRRAFRS